ncbi:MAG: outer membrane protein assembly factor BamB family protein, partial [Ktedonobacterales bacterium]
HVAPSVVVASRYGTLWALDARDGSILWRLSPTGRKPILVHGGDALYVSSHIPLAAFRVLDHYNGAPIPQGRRRPIAHAAPAEIVALRISDGTTIWQQEGWSAPSATSGAIALDGILLLGEGPVQTIGDAHIHAFDAHTGAIRWTYDASLQAGTRGHLLAARAGRVLVLREEAGPHRRLDVLDLYTGNTLWGKQAEPGVLLSDHGSLVALTPAAPTDIAWTIHNASDGQQIAALPPQSRLLAISDDGIAYVAGYAPKPRVSSAQIFSGRAATPIVRHLPIPIISAVRLSDGTELWRTEQVEAGTIVTTADALYSTRLTYPQERGEVLALDLHTGKLLWRWQTPGNLLSLLRLWGTRIPQVLIYAIAQARRSFIRARDYHDRSIIRREVLNGQWRRPTHLVSNVHLAVHADAVYLATSMGLFALHPRDGHLLWHALPTSELTEVVASP